MDASSSNEPVEGGTPKWIGTTSEHCQQMVDYAKNRSPMVKFMLEKMAEASFAHRLLTEAILSNCPNNHRLMS
jgi:hypothetical protein